MPRACGRGRLTEPVRASGQADDRITPGIDGPAGSLVPAGTGPGRTSCHESWHEEPVSVFFNTTFSVEVVNTAPPPKGLFMTTVLSIRDALAQGVRVAALHAEETGRPGKFGVEAARNHLKGRQDPLQDAWIQNTRELQALHEAPLVASLKRQSAQAQGRHPAILPVVVAGMVGAGFLLWRTSKVQAWIRQFKQRLSGSGRQPGEDPQTGEQRGSLTVAAPPAGNEGAATSA